MVRSIAQSVTYEAPRFDRTIASMPTITSSTEIPQLAIAIREVPELSRTISEPQAIEVATAIKQMDAREFSTPKAMEIGLVNRGIEPKIAAQISTPTMVRSIAQSVTYEAPRFDSTVASMPTITSSTEIPQLAIAIREVPELSRTISEPQAIEVARAIKQMDAKEFSTSATMETGLVNRGIEPKIAAQISTPTMVRSISMAVEPSTYEAPRFDSTVASMPTITSATEIPQLAIAIREVPELSRTISEPQAIEVATAIKQMEVREFSTPATMETGLVNRGIEPKIAAQISTPTMVRSIAQSVTYEAPRFDSTVASMPTITSATEIPQLATAIREVPELSRTITQPQAIEVATAIKQMEVREFSTPATMETGLVNRGIEPKIAAQISTPTMVRNISMAVEPSTYEAPRFDSTVASMPTITSSTEIPQLAIAIRDVPELSRTISEPQAIEVATAIKQMDAREFSTSATMETGLVNRGIEPKIAAQISTPTMVRNISMAVEPSTYEAPRFDSTVASMPTITSATEIPQLAIAIREVPELSRTISEPQAIEVARAIKQMEAREFST